jgi:hypothetical protein
VLFESDCCGLILHGHLGMTDNKDLDGAHVFSDASVYRERDYSGVLE